jgi:hypothetical protein
VDVREYNELKKAIGHRDALRDLAAAALADNMQVVVAKLVECEVLPPGTRALRLSIIHDG